MRRSDKSASNFTKTLLENKSQLLEALNKMIIIIDKPQAVVMRETSIERSPGLLGKLLTLAYEKVDFWCKTVLIQ